MKQTIELTLRKDVEVTLEGVTELQAIESLKETHPARDGWAITFINNKEIIGFDEGTGEPISDTDDYLCDEEGVMVLTKNTTPDMFELGIGGQDIIDSAIDMGVD